MNGTRPAASGRPGRHSRATPLPPCRRPGWQRRCPAVNTPIARDAGLYARGRLFADPR